MILLHNHFNIYNNNNKAINVILYTNNLMNINKILIKTYSSDRKLSYRANAILASKSKLIHKVIKKSTWVNQLKYLQLQNNLINQQKNIIKKNIKLLKTDNKIKKKLFDNQLKSKLWLQYLIKLKLIKLLKNYNSTSTLDSCGKKDINKLLKVNIHQELWSTWKLNRKKPKLSKKWGKLRKIHWKSHKNTFQENRQYILNYYKLKYLSYKLLIHYGKSPQELRNIRSDNSLDGISMGGNILNFLWQGKNFIKLLSIHPPLLDHLIKCLISIPNIIKEYPLKHDQLIAFLTYTWTGFFDYIYHFENNVFKWKGIRIKLSGRVGSRKMGRARRYTKSWGINKSSSARLPLQYTYSQIHTRYGVIGMKIFMR